MTALSAALEKQPITLIQGPPGTGKTRIILSLLSVILHAVPGKDVCTYATRKAALMTRLFHPAQPITVLCACTYYTQVECLEKKVERINERG